MSEIGLARTESVFRGSEWKTLKRYIKSRDGKLESKSGKAMIEFSVTSTFHATSFVYKKIIQISLIPLRKLITHPVSVIRLTFAPIVAIVECSPNEKERNTALITLFFLGY